MSAAPSPESQPLARAVEVLALAWVVVLGVTFALRITFPLELEWMEGGGLHQALRLLRGQAIYPAPSLEFVPFLYPPLYPAVLAGLASLGLPLGLVLGRAVSVAAFAALLVGLWRLVAAEGKPRAHRAAAVGIVCAGYLLTFRWYDVARADTLMYALLLWGLVLLRGSAGPGWRPVVAGVLVGLAFWTKQTAAVLVITSGVAGLVGLAFVWSRPRFAALAVYTATVAVIVLGGLSIGIRSTDGWLWTYLYELHQSHAFNHERLVRKTWGMFLHGAPALVLLGVALVVDPCVRKIRGLWQSLRDLRGVNIPRSARAENEQENPPRGFWELLAVAGLGVSAVGYATQWAEPNALIPGVVFGAAALAVALPAGGRRGRWGLGLVALHLVFAGVVEPFYQPVQDRGLAGLGASYRLHDPLRTIPSAAARRQAAELRAELRAVSGSSAVSVNSGSGADAEVLALHRPWWSVLAGGPGHVGSMGIHDVAAADQARLRRALREALQDQRYALLYFEGEPPAWLRPALVGRYRLDHRRVGEARVRPLTGYLSEAGMVTPYHGAQLRLARIADRPRPAGAVVLADFEGPWPGLEAQGFVRRGAAFTRPHPGVIGDLPMLGPHGGRVLLGSVRSRRELAATGSVQSPEFTLGPGGALEFLVGSGPGPGPGPGEELRLAIVDAAGAGDLRIALTLPEAPPWELAPVRWVIPEALVGRRLRLEIEDSSLEAAIFFDDLWLVGADSWLP